MFHLEKDKTNSTPHIFIDEEKGYMQFQGESFHENVSEFYSEIAEWLQQYLKGDFESFVFDCELKYFNSSTAKMLLNMFLQMDEASANGKNVTINWITTEDNEINKECGEDFEDELTNVNFHIIVHDI